MPADAKLLNHEQAEGLVKTINYYISRLPRVLGTLVAAEVETDWAEVTSGFRDREPWTSLGDLHDSLKLPGMHRMFHGGGNGAMNLADLLTVCCESGVVVRLRWDEGVPQLYVEKGY